MSATPGKAGTSTGPDRMGETAVQRKRPVLVILPYSRPVTGGIQADLHIVEQLAKRGWQVSTVHFADDPSEVAGRGRRAHLEFNLRLFRRARRLPVGGIVLEDEALSNTLVLFNWWARRRRDLRVVLVTHHLSYKLWRHPVRRLYWRFAEAWASRRADVVLANSESTRRDLLALGVQDARIRVVPFAAVSTWPRARRRETVEGPIRLLSVGTVEPRKGLEYLFRALGRLTGEDWKLDVVGEVDPRYHGSLLELAASLGLLSRVRFHGRVKDETLSEVVSQADVFVHPATWEGFGIAVLEALQAGLPVVASDAGGLGDLIDDGVTGLLVPPKNVDALAKSLSRVLTDPDLRGRLGEAAMAAVRDRYSWEKAGSQIDSALASL